jgi:DNA-binding FrmR family transcriptional regulator
VKQGLSNVEDVLLENHLGHCVHHQMQSGQTAKVKAEIIKVYKLKRK